MDAVKAPSLDDSLFQAAFWKTYAFHIWQKVEALTKAKCYGCNHNKTEERHHQFCKKSKEERVRELIRQADQSVMKKEVIQEWHSRFQQKDLIETIHESWAEMQFMSDSRFTKLCDIVCKLGHESSDYEVMQVVEAIEDKSDEECSEAVKHLGASMNTSAVFGEPSDTSQQGGELRPYIVKKVNEVQVKKFQTKALDYALKVKGLKVEGHKEVLSALESLFSLVLQDITSGMEPHDQVRFVMNSPAQLDHAISLPFMPLRDLTAMRILTEVERVLQSHQEFSLDGTVSVNLIHVQIPSGSGKRKMYGGINLKQRLAKKGCFVQIKNEDDLCCARAIVTAKARLDKDPKYSDYRHGRRIQKEEALVLHDKCGVPFGPCGLDEVRMFQDSLPNYQLVVVSAEHFNAILFKGPDADKVIYLYLHDKHYDIITSMPAFLNRSYFCLDCQKGYNNEYDHRCRSICTNCRKRNCPGQDSKEDWKECKTCYRAFKGKECFDNHLKGKKPTCKLFVKCTRCEKILGPKGQKPKLHKCGETRCPVCQTYVQPDTHRCYMMPIVSKKNQPEGDNADKGADTLVDNSDDDDDESEPPVKRKKVQKNKKGEKQDFQRYLFFDFECIQETGVHVPNLVVVQDDQGQEYVFHGSNTTSEFCHWLFSGENDGSICIAHNFKGYDAYFILRYLYDNKILPEIILNGSKVMQIEVPQAEMKFIDSLNFLGMPLAKFPESFGMTETSKGYFPHFFNKAENQDYEGRIPDVKYYDPDGMKEDDRKNFLEWHKKQRDKDMKFVFKDELLRYCRLDVNILRHCCLQFRKEIMEACEVDPFRNCITIASACSVIFRKNFLKEDTIGIIPHQGYKPQNKQSIIAHKWLAYLAQTKEIKIQHSRNQGEKKIGPYLLDGYDASTNTAYEFYGCFYHGCPNCFPADTVNPSRGVTMHDLYTQTEKRKAFLKEKGLKMVEMWECEFKQLLENNAQARDFVEALEGFEEPLEPREAFFGGRVNASKLLVETTSLPSGTQINYVDYTSLYPWVNKKGVYPLGHPEIITDNLSTDISSYFGLVKCNVLPPRGLYHPLLPYKCNGKLMFPLCRTCAINYQQTTCKHSDEERVLKGTWVSLELEKAVSLGYVVCKIHEVWHFPKQSSELFSGYVNTFLKRKQEASGWPSWCQTETDKQQYIQDYFEHEDIQLDYASIEYNKGQRTVWKQILNNFWGKFGQKPNKPKVEVIADPRRYIDILTSGGICVTNANLINDEVIELFYTMQDSFVESNARTNVVLAAFTTAQARLKLYMLLERLGPRVCYYDTDSVIYIAKENDWKPHLGDYLGDLTNELDDDDHIVTFVSAGPKNYSFCTRKGKIACKVKGITLNFRSGREVNLASMIDIVKNIDMTGTHKNQNTIQVENPHQIVRDSASKVILSKPTKKDYRLVYDKRVIQKDFDTLPYGY